MPPSIPTPSPQQLPPRSFHTILPPYPHHKPRLLPLVLNPSAASTKIQAQNNTHNRNKEAIKHIEIPFLLFPPHWRERKARGNVNQMKNETERECIVIKQRILEESLGKPWILGTDPETKAKIPSLQNQKYTAKTKIGQATRGENSKKPSPIRKPPLAMPIKHKARQDHMKVVRKEATSAKTSRGSQEFSASDSRSQETSISRQQIDSKRLYDAAPSSSMLQTDLDSPPALEIAAFTKTSMNTTEDENGANVFRHSSLDSHHEQITSDTSNDSASVASTAQASNSTSVIETSEKTGSIPSSAAKTSSPDSNDQIASQNAKTEARSRLRAEDAIDAKSRTIGKKSEKTQMATKKPIVVQTSVITGKRGAGKSITGMQLALLHTELGRIVIPVNMKEEAYGKRRYEILEDGLLQTERRELTADIVRLNMELLNKIKISQTYQFGDDIYRAEEMSIMEYFMKAYTEPDFIDTFFQELKDNPDIKLTYLVENAGGLLCPTDYLNTEGEPVLGKDTWIGRCIWDAIYGKNTCWDTKVVLVESRSHMPFVLEKPLLTYLRGVDARQIRVSPVEGAMFDVACQTNMSSASENVGRDSLYMMTGGNGKNLSRLVKARGCFA